MDPGFVYDATLARTVGLAVMRLADADLPVQRYGDFADTVSTYLDEVKKLADTKRDEQKTQAKLLSGGAYKLAGDPNKTNVTPTPLRPRRRPNFGALEVRRSAS